MKKLWKRDYDIEILINDNKSICPSYPEQIFFAQSENNKQQEGEKKQIYDVNKIKSSLLKCSVARARQRAPIPVIFLGDKNVSRSATLSLKMVKIFFFFFFF